MQPEPRARAEAACRPASFVFPEFASSGRRESPGQLAVNASRNLLADGGCSRRPVLDMPFLRKVLPYESEFPARRRAPAQPEIQRRIIRNRGTDLIQVVDIPDDGIELEIRRQIDHRLNQKLMMRIVALRRAPIDVVAAVEKNTFVKVGVTAPEPPPLGRLPCEGELRAVSLGP